MAQVSVHIPTPVLEAVDRRARSTGVSRSRYVTVALQQSLGPPQAVFLEEALRWHFQLIDPAAAAAIDAVLEEP